MAKEKMKKLTVMVPEDLLRRATQATQAGITPTIRQALQLVAARTVYDEIRALRGKVKFSRTWQELRGEE